MDKQEVTSIICSNCGMINMVTNTFFEKRKNVLDWNGDNINWIEGIDGDYYCPNCIGQELVNKVLHDINSRPLPRYYTRYKRKLPKRSFFKRMISKKRYSTKDIDNLLERLYNSENFDYSISDDCRNKIEVLKKKM